jgi:hypothetical protein
MLNKLTLTEEVILWCVGLSVASFFVHPIAGIAILALAVMFAWGSVRTVPPNPPTVAIPTVWEKRQRKIIGERMVLVSPFFPMMERLIFIGFMRQARTLNVKDIRCKPVLLDEEEEAAEEAENKGTKGKEKKKKKNKRGTGGAVAMDIGISFQPDIHDPKSLIEYLNAGGKGWPPFRHRDDSFCEVDEEAQEKKEKDDVWRQLEMLLSGTVRQLAAEYTWEELATSTEMLSTKLVGKLTGQQPTMRVKRDEQGKPFPDLDKHSPFEYEMEDIPPGYDFDEHDDDYDYRLFLQMVNVGEMKDVHGLGIIIRALNVERVDPQGELKKDAERHDREAAQRIAEETDFATENRLAIKYMQQARENGGEMKYEEALERVRINRGRATEHVVRSGNPLTDAAAIIANPRGPTSPPEGGTTS